MGFDFSQIGSIISKVMDTDYVDIRRDDGDTVREVYSNIPCHIDLASQDNPDPNTVDIKPVIQTVNVHCQTWVDLRNNDYLVAKKMDGTGRNILQVYSGRCGEPSSVQSRKTVVMAMNTTEVVIPTPIPPENPSYISIEYLCNDASIKDTVTGVSARNTSYSVTAPEIEGYEATDCIIDGVSQGTVTALIDPVVNDTYSVQFVYEASDTVTGFRFLVNGLYTKDDGSLASGYHLYKKYPVTDFINDETEGYMMTCPYVDTVHADNGKEMSLSTGTKIVLVPGMLYMKVTETVRNGSNVTCSLEEFTPDQSEADAYVTGWYD